MYVGIVGALVIILIFVLVPLQAALVSLPLIGALCALTAIDIRSHLLPDALTLPLLLLGLLVSISGFGPSPLSSALGAALGWGGIATIAYVYRAFRGFDGLGLGDAKLLGALGAWIGAFALPGIVLLAALLGLAYYSVLRISGVQIAQRDEMPFGPFLALAGVSAFIVTNLGNNAFSAFIGVM